MRCAPGYNAGRRPLGWVSTAAVSVTLSKRRFVSPELTGHIQEAVDQPGYRPNQVARSLRRQFTETIGLLVPIILSPFYPAVLKEFDNTCDG